MIAEKRYRVELEAVEPLRIGGVKDPRSGIENPVTKVGDRVVIPGPSLKGALRAELEQFLIHAHWTESRPGWPPNKLAFQPCIPTSTKPSADEQPLVNSGKYRSEACHYPCRYEVRRGAYTGECTKDGEPNRHPICPVCYLLGAMGLPGFVRVPFLYSEISPEELYSARIDRGRGTVVDGTNRPYQLVANGARFTGELVITVVDPGTGWRIGEPRPLSDKTLGDKWLEEGKLDAEELIATYVTERLESIKILGGYKSKGFGAVKIKVSAIE